ncbi:LysR family transcriptional regulator [Xenophilus azovorans]|uniref:LysR family transcriptional regulator n=1 Tax=Xenophilus azovorans TaxID=151755 RepID=UPI00057085C9|nr:LysR family transcriptional regulator [Xenophilus azovorans]
MNPDAPPDASRLDLNLVRVFVAIYETRSVTLAGDRLDLTQPTVSHALARLRTGYADRLFTRGAAGLVPTALCEQLYPTLKDALMRIEATLEETRSFDAAHSTRRFRIAMSDIGALYFTPPLLKRLQALAPHIQVDIAQPTPALPEDLTTGAVDLAVGNMPELLPSTRTLPLFEEHYVCLMARNHPTIGRSMSVEDFARARHVQVNSPASGHTLIDGILAGQGIVRNVVARVPQFSVLPYLVADTDLLVVLPVRVARLFVARGGMKALPIPASIPHFEVRMHWTARHQDNPAHRWMREQVAATLKKL